MILLVLSNLTFLGKNIPSFNQLTYDPSLGIHPGCKQRTACFWVLETPRTASESKSSVLASELRGPPERPDSFLSVAVVCVMHASTRTLWGCLYSYSCHSLRQQALWMCLSQVSQAPFSHPHLPYVALTARRSEMQAKPWPGRSYFEGPNGTWMKKGSKPQRQDAWGPAFGY